MISVDLKKLRLGFLKHLDTEIIERFRKMVNKFVNEERKKLSLDSSRLQKENYEDELDFGDHQCAIDDEYYFLDELDKLAQELCIVAAYKQIEPIIKRAIKICYPNVPDRTLSYFDQLERFLADQGMSIRSVADFSSYDELRLINNSIKHNDSKVSESLSRAYSHWQCGAQLDNLNSVYTSLAPGCANFIRSLIQELKNRP